MLNLADRAINEQEPRSWTGIKFCIQVDEHPALLEILRVLSAEGFDVSGDTQACLASVPPGRIVSVAEPTIGESEATVRVGVIWGEGGTLKLHRSGKEWRVIGLHGRWIARVLRHSVNDA